jgi:RNA polymerase sigma-70 factor, ECF subfamily
MGSGTPDVEPIAGAIEQSPSRYLDDDQRLLAALQQGDEAAFVTLLDRHHAALLRLATLYLPDRTVAEEVVQETWEGVLQGIHRFQARSSLKTWIFRILVNCAKTRAVREGRSVPFSSLWKPGDDPAEPAVEPERFRSSEPWRDHWVSFPRNWDDEPEERLLSLEARARIRAAIDALPPSQREVITLRDVEGWDSVDVCNVLKISETNQRVLLHRARSKVRQALEQYLERS